MSIRTGWIIAFAGILVGTAIGYVGVQQGSVANRERDALQGAYDALQAETRALRDAAIQGEAAREQAAMATPPADAVAPSDAVDTAGILGEMLSQVDLSEAFGPAEAEAPEESDSSGHFFTKNQARMNVNMQYGPYFRESNLNAEQRQAVRDILTQYMNEQFDGDFESLDYEALESWREAALREALGPVEYANFEAYEEVMHEHVMAEAYDMQLRMFSPELPDETREYVRDVFVSALSANMGAPFTFDIDDMDKISMEQSMALDDLEARLRAELLAEEFESVLPIIEQQRAMVEHMNTVMEEFSQED